MTDFKPEVGKPAMTRDGRKAHVLAIRDDIDAAYPVVGFVEGAPSPTSWTRFGVHAGWALDPSRLDLISEWKEPRKGEVWVAAFDDGLSERDGAVKFVTFRTEAEAKAALFCGQKAFAIKGVTLTEGQGLGEGSE